MGVDELGVYEMGVDEMGSRHKWDDTKDFSSMQNSIHLISLKN